MVPSMHARSPVDQRTPDTRTPEFGNRSDQDTQIVRFGEPTEPPIDGDTARGAVFPKSTALSVTSGLHWRPQPDRLSGRLTRELENVGCYGAGKDKVNPEGEPR